ncbi:MAG: lipocalin family protein [Chloroflexota bacterium]
MKAIACLALAALLAGCGGGPILANPPAQRTVPTPPPKASPVVVADPQPVEFPRDDAPHDRLTEWWYYTGHLRDAVGRNWGFEFVIFRAERGRFPVTWASHLALTDEAGGRFTYAQRSEIGPQVDRSPADGFDFTLAGGGPTPWAMRGHDGVDQLNAQAEASETAGDPASVGLHLALQAETGPALHDGDGWIDFGAAGSSYYYSRTRMAATGTLEVDGDTLDVTGMAWFDHQWGDFIALGAGGWDWFAVNLEDGTDLMLSLIRDRDGSYPLVYGMLVEPDGGFRHLPREGFSVEVTARWTSPETGAEYPAGWRIELPGEALAIDLAPTVAHQELDTRPTTGVVYWEGSQVVRATRNGQPLGGEAYVELTGYGAGESSTGSSGGSTTSASTASTRAWASRLASCARTDSMSCAAAR